MPRNLPNLITGSRLVMAIALFVLLGAVGYARDHPAVELSRHVASHERLLLNLSLVIFLLAAISDVLDGYIARRWGLQTDFGRIVDPFADKVIVCGAFIMLVPLEGSQVPSWMVVVILARELLVDGLRGFAESKGVPFPATASGKLKMFLQSSCLGAIFLIMANFPAASWGEWLIFVLIWLTVGITVVSGLVYVFHARKVLKAETLSVLSAAVEPGGSA